MGLQAGLPTLELDGKAQYVTVPTWLRRTVTGYQREETARFIAFRSPWGFGSEFCNPGRANEKGGVEGEVGYFRRNHWTTMPGGRDLQALNQCLESARRQDEARRIEGHARCVGAAMALEREHRHPCRMQASS